jgi:hypothetical protein
VAEPRPISKSASFSRNRPEILGGMRTILPFG